MKPDNPLKRFAGALFIVVGVMMLGFTGTCGMITVAYFVATADSVSGTLARVFSALLIAGPAALVGAALFWLGKKLDS